MDGIQILSAEVVFRNDLRKEEYNGQKLIYNTFVGDLKEGDLVAVQTKYGISVGKFIAYTSKEFKDAKFIVQKIDESDFIEKQKKLQEYTKLKSQIDHRVGELSYMKDVKKLAKDDDKLKELVKQLENL